MEKTDKPQLEFPLVYPLRIIGKNQDDFQPFVLEIVRRHVPDLLEENILYTLSKEEKYGSVSIEFLAQSREQVDALCAELGSHERIMMIL
jgi:putative lipoic acid-binding regulatory protein